MSTQHFGIDISSNNAHPLNWAAIKKHLLSLGSGQPFVIVKITESDNYVNPYEAADVRNARAAGFAVAGYLFDHANVAPGAEQTFFKKSALALPEALDIETADGMTWPQWIAHAKQLEADAPTALVYLNQNEFNNGMPSKPTNLWLAQYNKQPGVVAHPCVVHQYDDVGVIPGCGGHFDMNVWLGTEKQFNAFFELSKPAAPAKA